MNKEHRQDPSAFFVRLPFRQEDLRRPHLPGRRRLYVIEKKVELDEIDYENFVTDLCVDRWFIEENAARLYIDKDGVFHCLLVCRHGHKEGILIMSEGFDYPRWAAYLPANEAP